MTYHHHLNPSHPAHPLNPIRHQHHHRSQKTYTEVDSTAVSQVNNSEGAVILNGGCFAIVLLIVLIITFKKDKYN